MTPFRSLVVLKRPRHELWTIMRDHLMELVGSLSDIEAVREIERTDAGDGVIHIANEWRARASASAALQSILPAAELSWIDRNCWDGSDWTCTWTIEPGFLGEHVTCSGQTSFVPAMGGQGTRVTFAGELELRLGTSLVTGIAESIVTTIIPRNLRAVAEAAAAFQLPA